MIGVFDSGVGGLASVAYIREKIPDIDLFYIADTEHSPYGKKSLDEITKITESNIEKLRDMGAERVLIACCTASTVHPYIKRELKEISIPIVEPTARCAAISHSNGKIGVVATERTVRSEAFSDAIRKYCPIAEVYQYPAQELVGYIEEKQYAKAHEFIIGISEKIKLDGCQTLVLGCTHFSHARRVFEGCLPSLSIIDSAYIGALEVIRYMKSRTLQ